MRHTFSVLNFFAVLQSQGCADSTLGWIAVALAGLPAGEDSSSIQSSERQTSPLLESRFSQQRPARRMRMVSFLNDPAPTGGGTKMKLHLRDQEERDLADVVTESQLACAHP